MTIVDKQFFSIDSGSGVLLNGTKKSKIAFTFPQLVQRRDGVEECRIGIDHAVFPVSFYIINETNNYLHFLDDEEHYLNIAPGNYTARELSAELMGAYGYWSITISDKTGVYTILPV